MVCFKVNQGLQLILLNSGGDVGVFLEPPEENHFPTGFCF